MPRNNSRRTGSTPKKEATKASPAPVTSVLDFVTPTDFVELPSGGRFYDESHPLHNKETVEIRYMTAKDEDILTNATLLKKGLALEKLIQNVLVDKSIRPSTLLIGDRNAILVASRITGYGPHYTTKIGCPSCGEAAEHSFDLTSLETLEKRTETQEELGVKATEDGTFTVQLPLTTVTAEFRLLTGADEMAISKAVQKLRTKNTIDGTLSSQFARAIVSLNDEDDRDIIRKFALMMPAQDNRHLRNALNSVTPNVDLSQEFECPSCGYTEDMEVPLTADFFWPDR